MQIPRKPVRASVWAMAARAPMTAGAERRNLRLNRLLRLWEIAIKHSIGGGDMPVTSAQALHAFENAGYSLLDIKPLHALRVEQLAPIHRDPFDRLLVAQALVEPMTLITRNATVARYSDAIMRVD